MRTVVIALFLLLTISYTKELTNITMGDYRLDSQALEVLNQLKKDSLFKELHKRYQFYDF